MTADVAVRGGRRLFLLATLDAVRLAFPADTVDQILPAVAYSPLPTAPPVIVGVVNLRGEPLPLLDLRVRLGMPRNEPRPADHVVVCRVADRRVGVWLDHVTGLEEVSLDEIVEVSQVAQAPHVEGVGMHPDGTVLVCDVRSFLSADEALDLERSLSAATGEAQW
jgi:purine-binding chemotaxis protein CheW